MCGAVRVMCGADGFDDNVSGGCASPFEGCHGRLSYVCLFACLFCGAAPVNFRIAWTVVRKRRLRVASGRFFMQRTNSCATCCVCSAGERVGG